MSTAHELPKVIPLPPIDLSPSTAMNQELLVATDRDSNLPKSPSPSYAESFATAFTSHPDDDQLSPRPFPAPPSGLRKSLSVDSFVNVGMSDTRGARPSSPEGQLSPSRGYPIADSWSVIIGRSRGDSVSSVQEDYGTPIVDSDFERYDPNPSGDRVRNPSPQGPAPSATSVRGGELPLPSRAQAQGLSAASSLSSITSASTNSGHREPHAAVRSVTSLQSPVHSNRMETGRSRSGSLGVYTPAQQKRMTINTQVGIPKSAHTMVLAVVGTAACGKSSVVRKGLSSYSLSESCVSHAANNPTIKYTRRVGRVPSDSMPDCLLHVVEVDIAATTKLLPPMPQDLSALHGVIVCYDASTPASFEPVEPLLKECRSKQLPTIVLACKSDQQRLIEPDRALELLQQYDVGLVEVTAAQDAGKAKMRQSFDWLVKAILRSWQSQNAGARNPASPEFLRNPKQPWDSSRTGTPTASGSSTGISTVPFGPSGSSNPGSPTSPTRAKSTGDLLLEKERIRIRSAPSESQLPPLDIPSRPRHKSEMGEDQIMGEIPQVPPLVPEVPSLKKDQPTAIAGTLDELLDKLLFLAVSGDDPGFVAHFLLTYRRFTTPRTILLAMQKRMRQLDNPSDDPMFACFAQMRICHLLEAWIRDYPDDFAVRGTAGALTALIKSIISKTHLLHYGSEFLPFLEMLPSLTDQTAWALKADVSAEESDDSYSFMEDEEEIEPPPREVTDSPVSNKSPTLEKTQPHLRERKSSLPLTKFGVGASSPSTPSPKQQLKELVKLANDVLTCDANDLAQEITRQWVKLFMAIRPRDWLHYAFVSSKGKKPDPSNPVVAFNVELNHLADWVISLILCHDRPKQRARQVEKFVEIAHRLRILNNYSGLRAIVAGINSAAYAGDATMKRFKAEAPDSAKHLGSFDLLLQQVRAHRSYRMALKNTKGSCIPAMEVHMSDMIRCNEGNTDFKDGNLIHWAKFNMMGRFVDTTAQCQLQCSISNDYDFPERPELAELLTRRPVMDPELQRQRVEMDANDDEDGKESGIRKVIFWS
ncbi:ras guanine nucleotide exchange factor domain-containing protein [Coprinopsis sp. MPI-PUGE-AT-0042]|nr:ras guanine nucleotide exchange factor domain-containing protein [Coprinopsis sp. MPI-PUGE-AT-0042]